MKPSLRFEIFKRDLFTCRYCGKKSPEAILEVDHVVPESQGGSSEPENLVTACYECNRGKGARLLTGPAPGDEDLHEKAVLIAEHERQVEELEHWRAKQRKREDRAAKEIIDRARALGVRGKEEPWSTGNLRLWVRVIGKDDLLDLLECAKDRTRESPWELPRYFAGACWSKVRESRGATDG